MNPTTLNNPLVTSGLTGLAVQLTPTIGWIISGCHGSAPDSTPGLIAMGVIYAGHAILNYFKGRGAQKSAPAPAAPVQS